MPRPLFAKPDLPALRIAVGLFMILFAVGGFVFKPFLLWLHGPAAAGEALQAVADSLPWRLWQLAEFLLPGCCAGYFARRGGFLQGALLGLLTLPGMWVLVALDATADVPGSGSWWQGAGSAVLWCAAGGYVGEWLALRRQT